MATRRNSVNIIGDKELRKTLKDLGSRGETELRREVKRTLTGISNDYKRNVKKHYKTGDLDSSIKADSRDGWMSGEAGSTVEHSKYIEFGTRSRVIVPKRASVLRFNVGGEWVYAKKVQHPGTRANPGLLKAWLTWMVGNKFADRLRKRFDRIK